MPATITPVPTETTPPTTLPTLAPTLTTRPGRPTRTPIIIPIYSPTAPPPTATPAPPPQITEWRGEYFNNLSLIGQPVVVRNDRDVDFDWLTGSPDSRINLDLFSARWSRSLLFEAGTYRFGIRVDDGVRLFVDGVLVLDDWRDGVRDVSADVTLSRGNHNLRVEYYERGGRASIQMSIARLIVLPTTTAVPPSPTARPAPTLTPIPQPSSTAIPTQPPPPPTFTRTPTVIPDHTNTPVPTPVTPTSTRPNPTATQPLPTATPLPPTLTPIPENTATPIPTLAPTPTATSTATPQPLPSATSTPANTPTPTAIPADTATPQPSPTLPPESTPSPTPIPEASNTPQPTKTATPSTTPTVTVSLVGTQLQVTGTQWSTRVSIAISPKADGSSATPLGNARVNRRGSFTFNKSLTAPISSPLYVVVRERRVTVIVPIATVASPAPDVTPTVTPIP
jgi:hypothetical protein